MKSDVQVWRTDSKMRWTYVSAPSISACLVQMARVIDDFGLESLVTGVWLGIDDEGEITFGVLTEEDK